MLLTSEIIIDVGYDELRFDGIKIGSVTSEEGFTSSYYAVVDDGEISEFLVVDDEYGTYYVKHIDVV